MASFDIAPFCLLVGNVNEITLKMLSVYVLSILNYRPKNCSYGPFMPFLLMATKHNSLSHFTHLVIYIYEFFWVMKKLLDPFVFL